MLTRTDANGVTRPAPRWVEALVHLPMVATVVATIVATVVEVIR